MAGLKSLVKDTALYGLSSMVGRFLNYLLVPLYTAVLPAASGGYGVVTNVYAWAGLIMVLLTFGMETGFFRFANKSEEDPVKVYANSLILVGGISLIFAILCLTFLQPVSSGIWRSSRFHRNDDYSDGTRCFSVHSVCLSAFQEAAH